MEFKYRAKNQSGEIIEGVIDAPTENVAVDILQEKGLVVLSLQEEKRGLFESDLDKYLSKPNNKDIVIFTRQLSTLIDADMPLAEGLRTLSKQVEKPGFKKIVSEISETVEGGSSLSAALANYPKFFSGFYTKLVRSGEISGKLRDTLNYLADYMERTQGINSKIKGALAYPAFVLFAMVVVTVLMVTMVLPNLLVIFKEAGVEDLPFTTRILIVVTDFFNAYIYYIVIAIFGGIFAFWRYIHTKSGKEWLDDAKIKMPIFKKILKTLYLARISETLATLIKSDIAILDALKVTADLVGNATYKHILLDAEENVRGGGSISEIFGKYEEIPALMTSMIAIGERSGKLDFMLDHVSIFYRSESENSVQNISQLIEPVLIFILGIGVAALVSSVLLPMYSMVGAS
jgi:type IV pilus assembly protein PilC